MSSESDPDEFYDAQEPSSPRSKEARTKDENVFVAENVVVEEDPFEKEIVAEERRLLEERKLAEERRRKEDEELQRKLAELEKRKILEAEKKEAARRAQENESRRRKLDDMRMMMEEESTPNRAPPKPPRINDDSSVDNEQMRSCDEGGLDILIPPGCGISQLDVSSRDHDNTGHSSQRSFSQNSAELYEDAPSQAGSPGPYVDCDNRNVLNVNPPVFHQEKLQHKNIPIMSDAKNTNEDSPNIGLLSNSSTMDSINVNVLFDQEPDIIQSVKSSSLPRPSDQLPKPAQPVAPPRKKKKNKTPLTSGQDDSEESIPQAVDSEGQLDSDFVSEPETPTSTVYNLTKDLERSLSMPGGDELGREKLDITSATRGHRMVTAVEDESARGDSLERLKSANTVVVAQGQTDAQMESDNVTNTSREHHRVVFTPEMGEPLELAISTIASSESFLIPGVRDANQTPIHMERPRSMSGSRYMTDKEILEQVTVLNLDTGERVPLSQAEDKLPRCINPLSLHIMRRTKEYSSDSSLHKYMDQSDDESIKDGATGHEPKTLRLVKVKKRGKKLKKFIGKTVSRMKSTLQHKEENSSDEDEVADERRMIKVKASHSHKGPYDFDLLVPVQDMKGDQEGAVWTMKFSHCGRLLATGGQDNLMRVWVLKESYTYFDDMRQKYSEATKVSPAPSQESLSSQPESVISETSSLNEPVDEDDEHAPFMRKPFCIYKGHTADLLDISWSKNYFILSSSMDKTVRLWHVSRKECLCCFQHIDFVTAIAFHPKDDRYFLSGSLDGKLRLWNIPDKKVALWNEVSGHNKMITAANFCLNGKFAVVGTYDGRCIFYSTDQLKYHTHIHVRSTRGKNARGRKITGVEPHPGEDKVLVTSNDSRIRLYDLRDLTLSCKYKGCSNNSSQIKASFSHDGKYIICGSEDRFVYIWRSQHEFYQIFSSARRDRNDFWEGIKAHLATVTVAVFAPNPHLIIKPQFQQVDPDDQDTVGVRGEVLISADYTGTVKVFINKFKPGSG